MPLSRPPPSGHYLYPQEMPLSLRAMVGMQGSCLGGYGMFWRVERPLYKLMASMPVCHPL